MQSSSTWNDPRSEWKKAFPHGAMSMAQEDADDVKAILIGGGFVEPNPDGSLERNEDGSLKSCLLPTHTIVALGLFVRILRWERFGFQGHREMGIPPADDVLAEINRRMLSAKASRKLERWQGLRWQVYQDQVVWLSDPGLIVRASHDAEDEFMNALADFLITTTQHQWEGR